MQQYLVLFCFSDETVIRLVYRVPVFLSSSVGDFLLDQWLHCRPSLYSRSLLMCLLLRGSAESELNYYSNSCFY